MSNKEYKYKGGTTHRLAVLHAIGQLEIVNNGVVKLSDIIPFMNVSKPTAIKAMKFLASREEIIMSKNKSIGAMGQWEIELHPDMREEFHQGIYAPYFGVYCQRVLKVILQ